MTKTLKLDSRNKIILKLSKRGLTLGEIKIILKDRYNEKLSRERINQIIKRSQK